MNGGSSVRPEPGDAAGERPEIAPASPPTAPRRRSLRLELVATLTIILMMAVVSLSLATEMLGERRHQAQEEERLREHTRGLALLVTPMISGGATAAVERSAIEQALRPSVGSLGITAIELRRITRERAQTLTSLGLAPSLPPPSAEIDPEGTIERTDDGLIVVDQPIRTFGPAAADDRIVLRLVARPSAWSRVGDWQEVVVLALGVGAVLLVLGVLLLEMQVLRPLAHVRGAVGELARGNLQAHVPEEGPAELQSLAGAFNQMTRALDARIREIEAQREQLVRADQLASVGRIAAGVAHEVGNPLAAILGYVELLLDERTEPALGEEHRALLERTRVQIQRIQSIVGQLLEYSRPSRGQARDVEMVAAARQLLELLDYDPRCENVRLRVEGNGPIFARTDPALVDQVLQNLVVNGARAAKEHDDPEVVVRIEPHGAEVVIEVQDSGPGVSDDARQRLFEPFFTTAKAGEGTGLGLAISQGLVEGMGGTLTCLPADARPPLPGRDFAGAVFRVTLPAADRAMDADPPG